jgi:ubiquinone/menaquinone biosynthesis C-methylase UbiE
MTRPPNFDRVAHIYRWAEYLSLGPLLQRTRTHFLPKLPPCTNALILGDGDGRFLSRLLQQQPNLNALAVDTSASMLRLLRARCLRLAPSANLQTLQASALTITPPPSTDLIVTHFFLDCFAQPELDTIAQHLFTQTQPGTLWLVSDFAIPQARLLKPLAMLYIRLLYFIFRILTGLRVSQLPDPQSSLASAGFERITHHDLLCGLLYTEIWRHR